MDKEIETALRGFVSEADVLLGHTVAAAYCFGSAVYDDFHAGYSDLDFFILADKELTEEDFNRFHSLRSAYKASAHPYLSVLEGEIISLRAIKNDVSSVTIYWGTSKDRLNTRYGLSGFSLRGLLEKGCLLYGRELRERFPAPTDEEMLRQVDEMILTLRRYARETTEDIHSADWLFLAAQSLYWLKTAQVAGKTGSALWILEHCSYSWQPSLVQAVELRGNPSLSHTEANKKWLRELAPAVQAACDTLEKERGNR